MKDNFESACKFLFQLEGFKSDVVGDPGGRTIFGVAETYFPTQVRAMAGMTPDLAQAYAMDFYRTQFWTGLNCDDLPSPLDAVTFLAAVNPGPGWVRSQKGIPDWKDLLLEQTDYYCSRACDAEGAKPCCAAGNCVTKRTRCKRKFLIGWIKGRVITIWRKYK
jgi:hypothetical protein